MTVRGRAGRRGACCFFFQAEDGIRDLIVTGVQTCALPISTAWTGRDGLPNQKRTPPVMMNVLPPPTSPRASAYGVSLLPFNLNVVPPSKFRPALVAEMLVPPDGPADACAMFRPPPAYGRKLLRAGTVNRYATLPLISQ